MDVVVKPIAWVRPYERNPRRINARAIDAVAHSITRFGWQQPIVTTPDGEIIVGHVRYEAAKKLGLREVPVHVASLSPKDVRAYRIADNKLGELSFWDVDLLMLELRELDAKLLQQLGWTHRELQNVEIPESPPKPVVSRTVRCASGQLWALGRHRLICGDAREEHVWGKLFEGKRYDLLVSSPPYAQQRSYDRELGDWTELMCRVFRCAATYAAETAQWLVNLGLIYRDEWVEYWQDWLAQMNKDGWRRQGWYVWDKQVALPGAFYGRLRPAHEWVFHLCRKPVAVRKSVPKQRESRKLGNRNSKSLREPDGTIRTISSPSTCTQPYRAYDSVFRVVSQRGRIAPDLDHPAPFSLGFASQLVDCMPGDCVVDPFIGSGTTLLACETLDRTCYGIEIVPKYCDVVITRWERMTGASATLVGAKRGTRRRNLNE